MTRELESTPGGRLRYLSILANLYDLEEANHARCRWRLFKFYVFLCVSVLAFELHALFIRWVVFANLSALQTATESIDYHLKAFHISVNP